MYTERLIPLSLLPVYDLLYPLIPKWVSVNFIWRHCDVIKSARPQKSGCIENIHENWQNQFFAIKKGETWDFRRIFGWICKEMMILIYIASLKHIFCQIFKEMDKIRIMGFHPPPTILFDDPIPKRHPLISPHIHQEMAKECRNDYQVEAFGAVYWVKKDVLKKS